MRGTIGPGQSGAIHQECDRQILQCHFLEQLIVAALQEGAVDIDNRPQAGFRLPGGKCHGVRFANADVEKPVGKGVANRFQFVSLAHGGGEHGDARVVLHLLLNRLAGDIGVRFGRTGFDGDDFSRRRCQTAPACENTPGRPRRVENRVLFR